MNKILSVSICALLSAVTAFGKTATVSDTLGFDNGTARNMAELLKGKLSGVRVSSRDGGVNEQMDVTVRGASTLRGSSEPLWIVNGVMVNRDGSHNTTAFPSKPYSGYTSELNALPDISFYDIESITVLEDQAATALYGAYGANGVIIVNTKVGAPEEKIIDWDSNLGVNFATGGNEGIVPGFTQNHYIDFRGTTKRSSYNLSGHIRHICGVAPRDNKFSGGINAAYEAQANAVIKFGLNFTATIGNRNSTTGTAWLPDPSFMLDGSAVWKTDYDDHAIDIRALTSAYLAFNFTPFLSLRLDAGADFQYNNRYIWYDNALAFGKENNGAASILYSQMFSYNLGVKLNFDRNFKNGNNLLVRAGADFIGNWNKFNAMSGFDFPIHNLRAKGLMMHATPADPHYLGNDLNGWGVYGLVKYDYRKMFGFDASFRYDRNNKYYEPGKVSGNLYPGVSAFVDLQKIAFPESRAVSGLSLRGGWGKSGRNRYVPYKLLGKYLFGTYPYVPKEGEPWFEGYQRVMSDEWTAGVDIAFIGDRLKAGVTYYDRKSADRMSVYGFGTFEDNLYWRPSDRSLVSEQSSSILNRGLEFDFSASVLEKGDWRWSLDFNVACNANQMVSVALADQYGPEVGGGLVPGCNVLGSQVGAFLGFETDGSGAIVDQNDNGEITDADRIVVGSPSPKVFGGFGTTLSYRRFTLDLKLDGAAGFDILDLRKVRDAGEPYRILDSYVEKGDYLRLSRVSLSYDFKLKGKTFKSLSVNASGCNLATLSKYSGWNPDVSCFGSSNSSRGLDYGSYPLQRTVVLGISARF